jgi:hypothetical protein
MMRRTMTILDMQTETMTEMKTMMTVTVTASDNVWK